MPTKESMTMTTDQEIPTCQPPPTSPCINIETDDGNVQPPEIDEIEDSNNVKTKEEQGTSLYCIPGCMNVRVHTPGCLLHCVLTGT